MATFGFVVAGAYFAVFALALVWNATTYMVSGAAKTLRARQLPNEPAVDNPSCVVTLVHGTWARTARWTLPGSPLRQTVARAVPGPVLFSRFSSVGWRAMRRSNGEGTEALPAVSSDYFSHRSRHAVRCARNLARQENAADA